MAAKSMSTNRRIDGRQILPQAAFATGLCLTLSASLWSASVWSAWSDWWQTPEQHAAEALSSGDLETLKKIAPTQDWQGVGEYKEGNYQSAIDTFGESAIQHRLDGDKSAENDALYNQGVSQARNAQYQEAIDSFSTVLERDPDYADAEHNKSIAEQLLELQEQQEQEQQQQNSENGESDNSSENGEQQNQSDEGEQQPSDGDEQSESEEGEPSDSQNAPQSDNSGEQSGSGEQQADPANQDEEQDRRDAEQALAAEAASEQQQNDQNESADSTELVESPMSEADQAAEQLLRRIPDDPAGLLRRKLEQSHRSEFPEVGNAAEPW